MSTISPLFRDLIKCYSMMDSKYPQLKPITLAQWMLESGYGASKLATEHLNFGGLKWRPEMAEFATKVRYEAHDGVDDYCKFTSLENFIKGYWQFIGRSPYTGWEKHVSNGQDYIRFIGPKYCPKSGYAEKVISLLSEAEQLLLAASGAAPAAEAESHTPEAVRGRAKYQVQFYQGEYIDRQKQANNDQAKAYVEHHFNSSSSGSASYAVVTTGANASTTSRNWGRWYAAAIAKEFGTQVGGDNGLFVGGAGGRGDGNVKYTKMPAILVEPLFASHPHQADIIRSDSGQTRLARVLVESIQCFFPEGGLIAFSVGHKYKPSHPHDLGAQLAGGGWEAEFAEKVLRKAKAMLEPLTMAETASDPGHKRRPRTVEPGHR